MIESCDVSVSPGFSAERVCRCHTCGAAWVGSPTDTPCDRDEALSLGHGKMLGLVGLAIVVVTVAIWVVRILYGAVVSGGAALFAALAGG